MAHSFRPSGTKGGLMAAEGFCCAATGAAIKEAGRPDMALLVSDLPCASAGVFTRNAVRAHCVDWNKGLLPSRGIRALLCNSGNANACTGERGLSDTRKLVGKVADACGVGHDSVLVASTGVIGRFLPLSRMLETVQPMAASLAHSRRSGSLFARAIMTTDTRSKEIAVRVRCGRKAYAVGGCAKGSGMIHPNMATMLAFVTTDAWVAPATLNAMLKRVADRTFNNLTVDGDTSTNDMLVVLANGASGIAVRSARQRAQFERALFEVCNDLCARIAADGEGATKRVEINVRGGQTFEDARMAAKAIANSNLVKTAVFGNDPNWGRIACAIGYSGARFSGRKLSVAIGGMPVCRGLRPVAFAAGRMNRALRGKVVRIDVDLGLGKHAAIAHTCDFSYEYVRINAEYTT